MTAGFDADVAGGRGRGFLGPRGDNHGLAAYFPELLRPLEPHFTRRLAHILSPELSGVTAIQRTQTFISRLFDAAGAPFPAEQLPHAGKNLLVEAEARVPNDERKRRIDLLINWTDWQNNAHCLVVEAKFDAPVRPDAMRVYSGFALQTSGAPTRTHLFLMLKKQRPLVVDDLSWRQVTWLSVLRRWERHLAVMPLDQDFVHFRSALWRRA